MKFIKNIGLIVMMMLGMVSCVEETPDYGNFPNKDVDFTYNVAGEDFVLDFYVVSEVQFNNISAKSGAVTWDFGDGQTSTDANPVHKFAQAGVYDVTLTIEGVGSRTYPILIYDIAPVLSVAKQSATPLVINDATVELSVFLPNPENIECEYKWIFPEGTQRNVNGSWEDATELTTHSLADGTIETPGELRFKHIGSQKIQIETIFDYQNANNAQRRLEDSYVNVQVGCSYPCKTLYYAVKDGNIKAYKLADPAKLPAGTKIGSFDMGAKAGSMPTQMVYANVEGVDYIYTLDCGKKYTYQGDANTKGGGDGKITVMNADGTGVNTVVTNVGGYPFNDPFQGFAFEGYLYYTDRNTGIRKIDLTARGQVEESYYNAQTGYFVCNNHLGYYGRGIAYGAIHTGLYIDKNGMFYWPKYYSGNGIYRFQTKDINQLDASPHEILLPGVAPRAFNIDEDRNQMYVWCSKGNIGFNVYDLPSYEAGLALKDKTNFISMDADPVNNTDAEGIFVTQFAIDKANGNVYFGFTASSAETKYTTGIKYYDINTKKVVDLNGNKEKVLGIVVCDTETNLF